MKTDNQIIAEFMGMVYTFPPSEVHRPFYREYDSDGNLVKDHYSNRDFVFGTLNYDSDWSKLMPVVEKIENIEHESGHYYVRIAYDYTEICRQSDYSGVITKVYVYDAGKIGSVYKSVVDFIKWYNAQPKQ